MESEGGSLILLMVLALNIWFLAYRKFIDRIDKQHDLNLRKIWGMNAGKKMKATPGAITVDTGDFDVIVYRLISL